jgi:hypothetical protein
MPALTARIHNPTVRAFCERLKQHGKPHMVIVVAAMRELLHIVWASCVISNPSTPLRYKGQDGIYLSPPDVAAHDHALCEKLAVKKKKKKKIAWPEAYRS